MLIVTGTMEIEGNAEAAMAAAVKMKKATRAEKGCQTYAFWRDLENPNLFRVYEEWDGIDALQAHGKTDHMAEFRKTLGDIGVRSRDISYFEGGPKTQI